MRRAMAWLTCSMMVLAPALAQSATTKEGTGNKKPLTEKQLRHQARFKDCSAQAHGRKGDDRKQFMRDCLSK